MQPESDVKACLSLSSLKGLDVAARRRVNSIVSLPTNHFADFVAADAIGLGKTSSPRLRESHLFKRKPYSASLALPPMKRMCFGSRAPRQASVVAACLRALC